MYKLEHRVSRFEKYGELFLEYRCAIELTRAAAMLLPNILTRSFRA
jgi:hypothetical protein